MASSRADFDPVAAVFALYGTRGAEMYAGEPVSQLEHALQTAHLADHAGAANSLVVAALLHDIGHLLRAGDGADDGLDGRHELIGTRWVLRYFGAAVAAPIHLHVAAKRYLCAVDRSYVSVLSSASLKSLAVQGGPFDADAVARFERLPHSQDAARLRRWDDLAKVPGLRVPHLGHYRQHLCAAVVAQRSDQ
jgi:phosphonate degradation associated HDIG domain protein